MSTYDLTSGVYSKPADGLNKIYVMKNVIDFSVQSVAKSATADIFLLPANTLLMEVFAHVTTADADVDHIDVGVYGVAADDLFSDVHVDSTGWKRDTSNALSPPLGYLSTSDAIIYMTNDDSGSDVLNGAVIEFFALCVDLN
jgi:hypothetical protein